MDFSVGCAVAVSAGSSVGCTMAVSAGCVVGVSTGFGVVDSAVAAGTLLATLTGLSGSISSMVNPNPMRLIINTIADMPANIKRFLAGFFRIKLINAHKIKNGIHKKLMQNSKRKTLFIKNTPFSFVCVKNNNS